MYPGLFLRSDRAAKPTGIKIANQQRGLKKDQASAPDRGRSAEPRENALTYQRLERKEQEGAKKDGEAEQESQAPD